MIKSCVRCGTEFEVSKERGRPQIYCKTSCGRTEWMSKRLKQPTVRKLLLLKERSIDAACAFLILDLRKRGFVTYVPFMSASPNLVIHEVLGHQLRRVTPVSSSAEADLSKLVDYYDIVALVNWDQGSVRYAGNNLPASLKS